MNWRLNPACLCVSGVHMCMYIYMCMGTYLCVYTSAHACMWRSEVEIECLQLLSTLFIGGRVPRWTQSTLDLASLISKVLGAGPPHPPGFWVSELWTSCFLPQHTFPVPVDPFPSLLVIFIFWIQPSFLRVRIIALCFQVSIEDVWCVLVFFLI